jgi:hypothetical protein
MKKILFLLAFSFSFSNAVLENRFRLVGNDEVASDFVAPSNPSDPFKIEKLVVFISQFLGLDKHNGYNPKCEFSNVNLFMFSLVKFKFKFHPSIESLLQRQISLNSELSPSIPLDHFEYSDSSIFGKESDFLRSVGPQGCISFFVEDPKMYNRDSFEIGVVENLIVINNSLSGFRAKVKNILFADSAYPKYRYFYDSYFRNIIEKVIFNHLVCESCEFLHKKKDCLSFPTVDFDDLDFKKVNFYSEGYIQEIKKFNRFFRKVKFLKSGGLKCTGTLRGLYDGKNRAKITRLDLNLFSEIKHVKNGFIFNLPGLKEVDMTVMSALESVEDVLFENCPNLEVIWMTQNQFELFAGNVWEPKRFCIKIKAKNSSRSFVEEVLS